MPKGRRRRKKDKYSLFDDGGRIPLPDYAIFNAVCSEVGAEIGLSPKEVRRIYVEFVEQSLLLALPEPNPGSLPNDALLNPRRIIRIPGVASLEITDKSLRHFRKVQSMIEYSKKMKNNNK